MFSWGRTKTSSRNQSRGLEGEERPPLEVSTESERKHASKSSWIYGASKRSTKFSEREVRTSIIAFRKDDKDEDKTWTRRFVENVLVKQKWYNPNFGKDEDLDIRNGWAYYEHVTLARQIVNEDEKTNEYQRAEPGNSQKSVLYNPFKTPSAALTEWGLGVALYFATIRGMALALAIAGLISIPNILFFTSEDYSGNGDHQDGLVFSIRGSAICEEKEWTICEDGWCNIDKLTSNSVEYATQTNDDGSVTTFVQRSACNGATLRTGMVNYAAVMFLVLFVAAYAWYQSKKTVIYDEDQLTASDYSVRIKNPPPDATDPEEWHEFFKTFTDKGLATCTIVLNNERLLWPLIRRRVFRADLQAHLPDTNIDDEEELERDLKEHIKAREAAPRSCVMMLLGCTIIPIFKVFGRFLRAEELVQKLIEHEKEIRELKKEKYDVCQVIVTFQTEEGQRTALTALQQGSLAIKRQQTDDEYEENLFRGTYVLDASEPEEPSALRYLDLSFSEISKRIRVLITFCITIGLIALGGVIVQNAKEIGVVFAGFMTALLNIIVPKILTILLFIEKHGSEGSRQRSLYMKITFFRWFNTAIMARILTPFTHTLGADRRNDLLYAVAGIFVSELFLVPVIRLLDIGGLLGKHFFAPRAATAHKMYLCFMGSPYNLAERYTDMSKVIFLAFFYCALNPITLFLGSVTLYIQHIVDKFCLMRTWRSAPQIGTKLSDFSMKYYFSLATILCVAVSAYDWSNFRFDGVCKGKTEVTGGVFSVLKSGETMNVEVKDGNSVRVCSDTACCQNLGVQFPRGFKFPPTSGVLQNDDFRWMSSEQEQLTRIYGYTTLAAIIVYFLVVWARALFVYVVSLFRGTYEPQGKDVQVDFSSVQDIDGYVPQFVHPRFVFPFILCDSRKISPSLIGWQDPDNGHHTYELIHDVTESNNGDELFDDNNDDDEDGPIFSIIKEWVQEEES